MKVKLTTLIAVAAIAIATGVVISGANLPFAGKSEDETTDNAQAALPQIETIFVALDQTAVPVPIGRSGSGGALTSLGNDLIVMNHEGRFFDVSGDAAIPLEIIPPDNGWDEMLAFEEANPAYNFAHFYFRYNDLDVFEDQLIVSFTEWVADQECYRTTVATAPLAGASDAKSVSIAEDDWRIVFATQPCLAPQTEGRAIQGHMAGGRFRVTDDATLYLAAGDYAIDGTYSPIVLSQDPDATYGKVLAIDLETGAFETVSQGHSNMQGIVIDRQDNIYAVEHGRRGGDELNQIEAGKDYGWPQVSLGTRYNRLPLQGTLDYGRHPVFEAPVYSWLPSVAISSLTQIDGFHPAWDGDLLAGSLAEQTLFRIRMRDGRVLFNERIKIGARIRYVHQHGDQIALWTDQKGVILLTRGAFDASAQFAYDKIAELDLTERQAGQTELVLDQCAECHNFGVVAGGNAPPLGLVFGADIASAAFAYSDGLLNASGTWTREALTAYLEDPNGFAAGTSMPNPEIGDPAVLGAVVDILEALRYQPE